jgi:predicted Zn finger-like uncharacterized protein
MALATKCPHCNTIFRVAHDQLKLRGGIVRCGACNEVFDGNAALVAPATTPPAIALPDFPAPVPAPVPLEDKLAALDTHAAAELHADHEEPIYTLELDSVDNVDSVDLGEVDAAPQVEALAAADLAPQDALPAEPVPPQFDDELPPPGEDEPEDLDLDLDLDLNVDDAPAATPALAPAAAAEPEAPVALLPDAGPHSDEPEPELELDVESMSDAELEAALEIELAAIAAGEPDLAAEPAAEAADDVATARADDFAAAPAGEPQFEPADGRREPTFGEPPSEHLAAAAISDGHHGHSDDLLDEDEEALVQLSASARAYAGRDTGAGASATAPSAFDTDPHDLSDLALADNAGLPGDADADAAHATGIDGAAAAGAAIAGTGTGDGTPGDASPDFDEPGFVKRDRRKEQLRKAATIGMSAGSVLLVAALFGQTIATFRNPLAAYVPSLKPALSGICSALGCKIELPAQIDYVTIEQGELQTLTESTFSFTTLLRNQSTTAQAWPHIELVLDDASDKAILRRVFAPRDYLPAGTDLTLGFLPHSEQSVKLYFELAQLKASGYHIAVFYP